jgi:hypothetical protein
MNDSFQEISITFVNTDNDALEVIKPKTSDIGGVKKKRSAINEDGSIYINLNDTYQVNFMNMLLGFRSIQIGLTFYEIVDRVYHDDGRKIFLFVTRGERDVKSLNDSPALLKTLI